MLVLFYSYIDSIAVFDSYTTFRAKTKFWAEYPGAISWRRHWPSRATTNLRPEIPPREEEEATGAASRARE
jgi:hypothetical protein